MRIGLIGLQNSGKTTIFNALTGLHADIASYTLKKAGPNIGIVDVIDERITKLSEIYQPEKTIYANIEYIDFVGLPKNLEKNNILSEDLLRLGKTTDAVAVVVRNFNDDIISQTQGKPEPITNIEAIESDLIISDLIIAEKRLEKIVLSKKRGIKDQSLLIEEKAIKKAIDFLEKDEALRNLDISEEELKAIRGFQFLSQKPLMIILNSDENNFGKNQELLEKINKKYKVIEFAGNFEMELINLAEEEAKEFMDDINIKESARYRLTKFSYELLGYISFFTVGKDEVRAWTLINGGNAVEAAGKIHSDLARGFIRAECFSYDDLIKCGTEKTIREKGLFRLEGKNYIVQDGDILNIRFSV